MDPAATALGLRDALLIAHLLAFAVGAGAAFLADAGLVRALLAPERRSWSPELLELCSKAVWASLAAIALTGAGLVGLEPERLLASPKFQVKMLVVTVLVANGALVHRRLAPRLARAFFEQDLSGGATVVRMPDRAAARLRRAGFAMGAVSATSWVAATALGALRGLPFGFWPLAGAYGAALLAALLGALALERLYSARQARRSRAAVRQAAASLLAGLDGSPLRG